MQRIQAGGNAGLHYCWSSLLFLFVATLLPAPVLGQTTYTPYAFTTLAGRASIGSDDGAAASARFNLVTAVAVDSQGNTYVADTDNSTIRKITPNGIVSTLAGSPGNTGSTDGTGSQARFFFPAGVTVDASGNVYAADTGNNTVRKITPAGVVTTLAGTAGSSGFADGTGANARFDLPTGLTIDDTNNIYVADTGNNLIRRITPAGVVTTYASAGTLQNRGSVDGTGSGANFNSPHSTAVDSAGNVYVAEIGNHTIRKITPAGVVTTLAGTAGTAGSADGTGAAALFRGPAGVAVDSAGNVYVADTNNHTIRKITPAGVVTTLAGTAGTTGSADGTGAAASFLGPAGLAVDSAGNLYVSDNGNHTIRKITPAGVVTTLAGTAGTAGSTDGTGSAALFASPVGIGVDGSGNVYVADSSSYVIRKITPAGVVTTFAGYPNFPGSVDGTGTGAQFRAPVGLAVDGAGNVYVADTSGETVRKITSAGVVTTLAGFAGLRGTTDAIGNAARFSSPTGVSVDSSGNLYVADFTNNLIRKVAPDGTVSTLAGSRGNAGYINGASSAARFNSPGGLTIDHLGTMYVADTGNNTIREINSSGVVTTFGGSAVDTSTPYRDGLTNIARFSQPGGVAADDAGNLYVTDTANSVIRKITPDGVVSTLAGTAGTFNMIDGNGTSAAFNQPVGISVDSTGTIYVADTQNAAIRKITADGTVTTFAGAGQAGSRGTTDGNGSVARFNEPSGMAVDQAGNIYVADTFNNMIRKVAPDGTVTTHSSNAGAGITAPYKHPTGVAVDGSGNIYVANTNDATIVKITTDGTVSTLAGTSAATGNTDGTGAIARFSLPESIAVDNSGNLYVADASNHTIRKVTTVSGVVTTLAGTAGTAGSTDGTGSAALFNNPYGIAVDGTGNVYVTDTNNHTIRKITPAGVVTTLAGTAGASGSTDGTGSAALFRGPTALTVDSAGNVYVADTGNQVIRKVTSAGVVTTLAGIPGVSGNTDGSGSEVLFHSPAGIAVDAAGNIYVSDSLNNTIRKGLPASSGGSGGSGGSGSGGGAGSGGSGAGGGTSGSSGAGNSVIDNAGTTGGRSLFLYPTDVGLDSAGNAYVTDASYNTVQKITPAGKISTLAGTAGVAGMHDGLGGGVFFNQPGGNVVDGAGNIYVADTGNAMIRKIAPDGTVTTFAGSATNRGNQDGSGTSASFSSPNGIAVDGAGNVYVADSFNETIRKITPAGVVSTLAGAAASRGDADGTGGSARFNYPAGVAVDGAGNVYVADAYNDTIRKITPGGVVTTLAGSAGISGSNDGTGIYALFNQPIGLTADGAGNVYVADTGNATIRKVMPDGTVTTVAGMAGIAGMRDGAGSSALFNQPRGIALDSTGKLYVADTGNAAIRKIALDGTVSTVAATPAGTVAPAIVTQPTGGTAVVGSSGSFGVVATGSPAPTYQWRKDGADIAGATSDTYTITKVAMSDAGTYTVVVTNSAGSVTSNGAILTVISTTGGAASGSGGGSMEAWFAGMLALLGAARWMTRKS